MRTVLILICFFLQACLSGREFERSLNGEWIFSYKMTHEYRSPDDNFSNFINARTAINDIAAVTFNTDGRTISFDFFSGDKKTSRYRVIKDEKSILVINNEGTNLSFEPYGKDAILMCPLGASARRCSVLVAARKIEDLNPDRDVAYIESNVAIYTGIKSLNVDKYIGVSFVFSSKSKKDVLLIASGILGIKDAIADKISSKTPSELENDDLIKSIALTSIAQVTGISSGIEVEITKKDIF